MKYIKYICAIILAIGLFSVSIAQEIPERPSPQRLVNDFANVLSQNEQMALEQKLVKFNNETSVQIAFVTVKSLHGYDKNDFAARLGEKWGVGQKKFDNGIVLLVKPKTADSRGQVSIQVGYGIEGVIPDAIAKRIVEKELIPYFKQGQMYKGIDAATSTMISLTRGEYSGKEYMKSTKQVPTGIPIIFFVIIFFVISALGRVQKARRHSIGHNVPFWVALSMMSAGSHRGSYNSFSSGSGGFGSSGGGFGGFGGGGFGGGGAGGSW